VTESDPWEVGRIIALRLLDAMPRTERQLREALEKRGIPPEVATGLVERYVEVGLLDDRAYARVWVESRVRTRGLGRMALRQELRRKGVADELIEQALSEVDPQDAFDAAVEQVRPRVARCTLPLTAGDERRLIAFLARRGHSPQAARDAVRAAAAEVAGT
jgi:regulatory protein